MNIVYRRFRLSAILSKLAHFLLLKRTFSYDLTTKPLSICFVKRFLNLKAFTKQKQAVQFPVRQIGGKDHSKYLSIFGVTKLISRMVLSTQEKNLSTATLGYSCPRRLPKIPRKLFAT